MNRTLSAVTAEVRLNPPSGEDWSLVSAASTETEDWGSVAEAASTSDGWALVTESTISSGVVGWVMGRGFALDAAGFGATLGSNDGGFRFNRLVTVSCNPIVRVSPAASLLAQRRRANDGGAFVIEWQRIDTPSQYKVPGAPLEFTITRNPATFIRHSMLKVTANSMAVTFPDTYVGFRRWKLYADGNYYYIDLTGMSAQLPRNLPRRIIHVI